MTYYTLLLFCVIEGVTGAQVCESGMERFIRKTAESFSLQGWIQMPADQFIARFQKGADLIYIQPDYIVLRLQESDEESVLTMIGELRSVHIHFSCACDWQRFASFSRLYPGLPDPAYVPYSFREAWSI